MEGDILPKWAPRVTQAKIRRLYELDALGIHDEQLLDEVGYALRARCQSFIAACQATGGQAACPVCGELFDLQTDPRELHNRWTDPAYAGVKQELLLRFVQAEIQREPMRMPRIANV